MSTPQAIKTETAVVAVRLTLVGRVQGVGLRPAVARWARELALCGRVTNTRQGVEVLVEGRVELVRQFTAELADHLPAATHLEHLEHQSVQPDGGSGFAIVESTGIGPITTRVPQDLMVCDDCLSEIATANDRRADYPFTSCTRCGPRYSIIDALPYERAQTGMSRFSTCPQCVSEYESSIDRRFHSQTNACSDCGPHVWCCDASGRQIAARHDAIKAAATAIRKGRIVALRGLGGYQLMVDATSDKAVQQLRNRKRRYGKPLAVMVGSLEQADRLAELSETERQLLRSPAGPIVIASSRHESALASSVAPGIDSIGVMLPTTPLHWLLLKACHVPLVVTSGNREGDPLAYQRDDARRSLEGVADLWLEHDRPIRRPIDDSVVRVMAGRAVTIRLARGVAPLPLDVSCTEPVIALGGHQKVALAICNGEQSVLGPHIGDLQILASRERLLEHLADMQNLYGSVPTQFVTDKHPDYFTNQWAEGQLPPVHTVQHHHAHVVAGMLEHHWLDRTVLGVSFDGTGFGDDGTIWGGEFLLSTATGFQRVGHLRPFRLPGGEKAVREPWRVAVALVQQSCGADVAATLPFTNGNALSLLPILDSNRFAPITTSAGRLFDGVAALVLGIEQCDFEGQAAMLLEAVCDHAEQGSYPIVLRGKNPVVLDWRPLITCVLNDHIAGVPAGVIAMRFHRGLAEAITRLCRRYQHLPVVLGGGVFQNRVLVELLDQHFTDTGQTVGLPGIIPPNDGGLAAGQLAVVLACAKQGAHKPCV